MFGSRIVFLPYGLHIRRYRSQWRLLARHKILNESRCTALCNIEHVIQNENLTINEWTGADANHRNLDRIGYGLADFVWHAFE